jgi:hypothetical protein
MMLADDILTAVEVWGDDPAPVCQRLALLAPKIKQAERFQFDAAAVEAVLNLVQSKPSSILEAAQQFARPPYDVTWIEWPMPDDPVPLSDDELRANAIGALIETTPSNVISVSLAHRFDKKAFSSMLDEMEISPQKRKKHECLFAQTEALCAEFNFNQRVLPPHSGLPLFSEPPTNAIEAAAMDAFERCVTLYVSDTKSKMTDAALDNAAISYLRMLRPVVGMLILLNSKNCVSINAVTPPVALNKARVKRGKLPLISYHTVKIDLGRRDARQASAQKMPDAEVRQHLVRGHFKIRKTGVYWWRNHIRGAVTAGAVEHKSYRVTA